MHLSLEQIKKFLPHRDPFLFVDEILSIRKDGIELNCGDIATNTDTIGIEISGSFFVAPEMDIFRGHFPGNPIFPGVIQIEMMAQTACFAICARDFNPFALDLRVAFMGVTNVKFRKPVLPGMKLRIECICRKCRGDFKNPIMSYDCKVYNNDTVMSECSLLATVSY